MRLLERCNDKLKFSLRKPGEKYAILSHRWLPARKEVTYANIRSGQIYHKPGYQKLDFCLARAERDGYKKVWIDSCCIDRANSTELDEALNSMFNWYADAAVCYVYLADVTYAQRKTLNHSDWFKRGWTLQELIAPADVQFFSSDRRYLGNKDTLKQDILAVTNYGTLQASIPERYSWCFGRKTTRPEDMSYSLIGLLGVHLVPIYGEGATAAQERLFDAIQKEHGKKTIREIRAEIRADDWAELWAEITIRAHL